MEHSGQPLPGRWTEQTIKWFVDASEYTGFHQKLAALLLPHLRHGDSLCDIGCGLGRIDLALAPYVREVTAVDNDPRVVDHLALAAAGAGLENIRPLCENAEDLPGVFDVVLMSFFGRSKSGNFAQFLRLAGRRLIWVVNRKSGGNLYPGAPRYGERDTVDTAAGELQRLGLHYELFEHPLEFGQPLRSRADAAAFVACHAPGAGPGEIEAFLQSRLQPTGHRAFPLFLPNQKIIGVFVVTPR